MGFIQVESEMQMFFTRMLRVRIINLISSMLMEIGVFVLILLMGCLMAFLPVLLVSAGFEMEIGEVFLWAGIPLLVFFVSVWFYKYSGFARVDILSCDEKILI
jgi:hypothetical protein